MKFISICSGIEAASVAFGPLGWKAVAFSEIEPFPCAVLAHHYPDVPNLGDMTKFREWPEEIFVEADAIVGGPPCQAFSIAGLRNGLDDDRGNLTLTYAELINHADAIRLAHGKPPVVVLYENVPGLLSDKTNAFGCFLAGLAGEDEPLVAPGGKWSNAGYVLGPKRAIAWRVLDAQYFGLAQRRRRVFVVASARKGFDPAAVLFEFDGVRRDTPPSREAREIAPTIPARSLGGGGLGTDFDCDGGVIAQCRSSGTGQRYDPESETLVAYAIQAGALRTNPTSGPDGVGVQAGHAYTLEARAEVQAVCVTGQGGAKWPAELAPTLNAHFGEKQGLEDQHVNAGCPMFVPATCIAVHGAQDPCVSTATAFALGRNNGGENAIAFSCKDHGGDAGPISPTLRGMGHEGSHANAGGQVAVAVSLRGREGGATAELGDEVGNCLRASGGGGDKAHVLASVVDTLYNKGIATGDIYASTQETHPGTLLRALRQEVGEEAFAKWGLGILDSLQQAEVLRQALHGLSVRPAAFSRSWVVYCALSRQENRSGWLLQSLREAGCERCSSQGWEPSEQLARELGAYLSELSRPGAQAAMFVHDLWQASEGFGVLRHALSAIQEVRRSPLSKGQPVHGCEEGRRLEANKDLFGSRLRSEIPCERILHETCATSEARDHREGAVEQERCGESWLGETPFAVRRLTVEECEFLQGFPRGYSRIPWRKKPASECPDGPRYKALGNSWAVPNVRWIGERIQRHLEAQAC